MRNQESQWVQGKMQKGTGQNAKRDVVKCKSTTSPFPLLLLAHLEDIKLQADALNPTYIKAFLDTVILYYTTTTPLFRSTPSLLLRYVLPHDNKDPSSSEGNYVPEFSVMFWGAFLFQSLLWQRCAEVHVE